MTIITSLEDSFTADQERFWSQRFTKVKLYAYLPFVAPQQFVFKDLDTYEYVMQVRIKNKQQDIRVQKKVSHE